MPDEQGLTALYAEALRTGAELCALLESDSLSDQLSQVEALLDQRQQLADAASRLVVAGADVSPHRTQLEQIMAQQQKLERLLEGAITALQKRIGAHQQQKGSVDAVRRLLHNTTRSQTLNTRR
jgi:predicted component of type VI protein secretion system